MRMPAHTSGTDKGQNEGTRPSRQRFKLGMKKRCDVEPMTRQLHRADVSRVSQSGDPQARGIKTRHVVWIHSVIAKMACVNGVDSIDGA